MKKVWTTRKDNHDYMESDHVARFLRHHKTGVDNHGRIALAQIIGQHDNPTVLDCACGTAVNYEVIQKCGVTCEYTGLDRTQKLIDHAKELYAGIDVRQGYVEELPFEDESQDIVIMRHILEHLEEGYEIAVKEAIRVAKKEAIFVFFLDPSDTDADDIQESEPDENGCTYFWNTYSWPKFVAFLNQFGYRYSRHRIETPGAAHADTIVRIIK